MCVIRCLCVCARTLHLRACVRETRYYQRGSVVKQKRLKWYPEFRHQTPEAGWVMAHRSTARTKAAMVKRMEMVEERDRWSRQKTSSLGVCSEFCLGSEALGFMSVGIWRKSCSLEEKSGERMRERCKGMCGALRVWMIGEINQVPSWPSCQSTAFPSAPLQYNYVSAYFFLQAGHKVRCSFWECMAGEFPSVRVCFF